MARRDAVPAPDKRPFSRAGSLLNGSTDVQHLFVLGLLLILYVISIINYLVFHSLIEIFTIVIASCIFVITWNSRKYLGNNFFVMLGIAYLFISIIDITHLLAYKGMNVFPGLRRQPGDTALDSGEVPRGFFSAGGRGRRFPEARLQENIRRVHDRHCPPSGLDILLEGIPRLLCGRGRPDTL